MSDIPDAIRKRARGLLEEDDDLRHSKRADQAAKALAVCEYYVAQFGDDLAAWAVSDEEP